MSRQDELRIKIKALEEQMEPLEKELHELIHEDAEDIEKKIKLCNALKYKFDPKDLRFASTSRCPCGAGLAYPIMSGINGCWHCSAILMGTANVNVEHTEGLPFAFWDIRSEDQSDNESTTRPK